MDADDDDVAAANHELSGTRLDPARLRASRLLWALTDVAAFTAQLRGEHRRDADEALGALRNHP